MSLVIRLLHDEERELRFWFQNLMELESSTGNVASIFAGPVGSGETTLMQSS